MWFLQVTIILAKNKRFECECKHSRRFKYIHFLPEWFSSRIFHVGKFYLPYFYQEYICDSLCPLNLFWSEFEWETKQVQLSQCVLGSGKSWSALGHVATFTLSACPGAPCSLCCFLFDGHNMFHSVHLFSSPGIHCHTQTIAYYIYLHLFSGSNEGWGGDGGIS